MFRTRNRVNGFTFIASLHVKSFNLAIDLKKNGKRIVIVDPDPDNNLSLICRKHGIRVLKDVPYANRFLSSNQVWRADTIYLMSNSDEENIRALQELDRLQYKEEENPSWLKSKFRRYFMPRDEKRNWYLHLSDERYVDLFSQTKILSQQVQVYSFNLWENISRRLLIQYPIDRFERDAVQKEEIAEVIIIGWSEMAREILLQILKIGHFEKGKKLQVTVFVENHREIENIFYYQFPALWYDAKDNPLYEERFASDIRKEIFPEGMIEFIETPTSDIAWFNEPRFQQSIGKNKITSFYFCDEQTMFSAARISLLLPRIDHLQRNSNGKKLFDVQIFCFFTLQDNSELIQIEHRLNAQIPNSPIIFFGNLSEECTFDAIEGRSLDKLPRLINYWYSQDKLSNKGKSIQKDQRIENRIKFMKNGLTDANDAWDNLSLIHKESSRYAADHLWVKLRILGCSAYELRHEVVMRVENTWLNEFTHDEPESPWKQQIINLSIVEHRRWCAEKLLAGMLPLQDFYPESITNDGENSWIDRWNTDSQFRKNYQNQKLHIDLLPFEKLPDTEKAKDLSHIEGIPYFLLTDRIFYLS